MVVVRMMNTLMHFAVFQKLNLRSHQGPSLRNSHTQRYRQNGDRTPNGCSETSSNIGHNMAANKINAFSIKYKDEFTDCCASERPDKQLMLACDRPEIFDKNDILPHDQSSDTTLISPILHESTKQESHTEHPPSIFRRFPCRLIIHNLTERHACVCVCFALTLTLTLILERIIEYLNSTFKFDTTGAFINPSPDKHFV